MIIYQVIPNRAYPYIISSLFGENYTTKMDLTFDHNIKYFKNSFEFSEIFDVNDLEDLEKMYAYQTEVIRFHPDKRFPRKFKDIYHKKYYKFIRYNNKDVENLERQDLDMDIHLLHGLFSSKRLNNFKSSQDFSFSFIDDPVQSIYNLYRYTYYVYKEGIEEFNRNYYFSMNNIPELDFEGRNYIHYYELLKKECTLEKFIDKFIESNGKWTHNFFYFPVSIYEEATGRLSKMYKHHDFYGIVNTKENLINSIKKFNDFTIFNENNFRIDINLFKGYFETDQVQNDTYRKEDLQELMKEDIEFFNQKVKLINDK